MSEDRDGDAPLAAFIGRNADFYLREGRVMARSGTRVSWNWPALLFNVCWLAYRKMWAWTALMFVLVAAFNLTLVLSWLSGVACLLLGMYGNVLYLAHARRRVAQIRETAPDADAALAEAAEKGGVSPLAAWLVFALFIVVSVIGFVIVGTALTALLTGLMWWEVGQWATSPPQ